MLKLLFVLPAALLFAFLPQEQTAPPPTPAPAGATAPADAAVPAEAAAPANAATPATNPVKPTPESQARAKSMYAVDCAICHGANGNGKGELVSDMQLKMKDFTDSAVLKDKSDGDIFTVIKAGDDKLKMPAEGPRAKDAEMWNMVILLRSFAKK
jgi:mono/diheme cytochrome c family protein